MKILYEAIKLDLFSFSEEDENIEMIIGIDKLGLYTELHYFQSIFEGLRVRIHENKKILCCYDKKNNVFEKGLRNIKY